MLPHRDTESGETLPVAEKVSRFRGSGTIDGTGQVASIVMPRRCRRALNAPLGRFFASLMPCSNLWIQKKNTTLLGGVLFGAAGEIRSRCYHTATRTAGTKRPTGAFFRFAHALFESLDTKKNTTLLGGVLFGAAGEIRTLGTLLAYTRFPVVLVMTASILLRIVRSTAKMIIPKITAKSSTNSKNARFSERRLHLQFLPPSFILTKRPFGEGVS